MTSTYFNVENPVYQVFSDSNGGIWGNRLDTEITQKALSEAEQKYTSLEQQCANLQLDPQDIKRLQSEIHEIGKTLSYVKSKFDRVLYMDSFCSGLEKEKAAMAFDMVQHPSFPPQPLDLSGGIRIKLRVKEPFVYRDHRDDHYDKLNRQTQKNENGFCQERAAFNKGVEDCVRQFKSFGLECETAKWSHHVKTFIEDHIKTNVLPKFSAFQTGDNRTVQLEKTSLPKPEPKPASSKVVVVLDVGMGHSLNICGEGAEGLSWNQPRPLAWSEGNRWFVELKPTADTIKFKVLRDKQWQKGDDVIVKGGKEITLTNVKF